MTAGAVAACRRPSSAAVAPSSMCSGANWSDPFSVIAAGYMPLDVVLHEGQVMHAAGGTAGNVAAILAHFGWESKLAGDVGHDPAADLLLADLAGAGVSTDLIGQSVGPTSRVVHRISDAGHVFEYSCPACGIKFPQNRRLTVDRAGEIAESVPAPTVFFFDRANPGTVRLAQHFKNAGAWVVFEPAFGVDKPFAQRASEIADLVKIAASEGTPPGAMRLPRSHDGQVQIVTYGSLGAEIRAGNDEWQHLPAMRCDPVVDTAGSGDWTTAIWLHSYFTVLGCTADTALRTAQLAAALNCGHPGSRGVMTAADMRHGSSSDALLATPQAAARFDVGCPVCLERRP